LGVLVSLAEWDEAVAMDGVLGWRRDGVHSIYFLVGKLV
jgi:hypothetical protein